MEAIKLQCVSSVELKGASGTSQQKLNCGNFASKYWLCEQIYHLKTKVNLFLFEWQYVTHY